jgi:2'-hydroxyisoflavone reductase
MQLLVLGGTKFVGRHVVDLALERGHDVTLFNRGETRPELFPEVEKLRGDRDGNLDALAGRSFDAVVDTSGYVPRVVRETIEALGTVGHYTFVSSISVYADCSTPPTESSPLLELVEPTEDWREAYGELKVLCEEEVRSAFSGAFIARPGLIAGPWDPTGRFSYWPERLAEGGRVLAPAPPDAPAQVVDARDLAAWIVLGAETQLAGTFNAVDRPSTRAELLTACADAVGGGAELVWVAPQFLTDEGVGEWMELPLWLSDPSFAGMLAVDPTPAFAAGLHTRPIGETARDTLAWLESGGGPADTQAGLARDKEQRILDGWLSKE